MSNSEEMSQREIKAEGIKVSEKAVGSLDLDPTSENYKRMADPEMASIMAEWDSAEITRLEKILEAIDQNRLDQLTDRQRRGFERDPEGFKSFLEQSIERRKVGTPKPGEVAGAAREVVQGPYEGFGDVRRETSGRMANGEVDKAQEAARIAELRDQLGTEKQ